MALRIIYKYPTRLMGNIPTEENMKLWMLFWALFTFKLFACGTYDVQGVVRRIDKDLKIVVNEHTKSEVILNSEEILEVRLLPYLNKAMMAKIEIKTTTKGSPNKISNIYSIGYRVPNPLLAADDTFIKLIKKSECVNEN